MNDILGIDPMPWSSNEDEILRTCWGDPAVMYAEIARLLPRPRTPGAIKHRGYKIGLGSKAKPRPPKTPPAQKFSEWPQVIRFDDSPKALAEGFNLAKAVRVNNRHVDGR